MLTNQDFRQILKQELIERCQRNPKYSLRAFAKFLKLDATQLSDVLRGKKGISRAAAAAIAKTLGFSEDETGHFCDLVESAHGRSALARETAQKRAADRQAALPEARLTMDAFRTVSDWHHFALLQLLKLDTFVNDPNWMAKQLGITVLAVDDALARLERLELIEKQEGRYQPTSSYAWSPDGVPSEAIKKCHEQILNKAREAILMQSVEERDLSAVMIPISSSGVAEARKKIRKIQKELSNELSSAKTVDRVYCLSVQFFSLTQTQGERT